jgi:hypothetical protein
MSCDGDSVSITAASEPDEEIWSIVDPGMSNEYQKFKRQTPTVSH